MTIQAIIFYLLLLDALSAIMFLLFGKSWYKKHFLLISRWFPLSPGWCAYYLLLVLWVGYLLLQLGLL